MENQIVNFKQFIKNNSDIDETFINDIITSYKIRDIWIESDKVIEIMEYNNTNGYNVLKNNLKNNFVLIIDYKIDEVNFVKNKRGQIRYNYLISVECFKQLCMMRKNEVGERIRKYFIKVEDLAFKFIENQMNEQNKIIEEKDEQIKQLIQDPLYEFKHRDQTKTIIKNEGRILYVITNEQNKTKNLFKIGITDNIKNRLSTLNTSAANSEQKYYSMFYKKYEPKLCAYYEEILHYLLKHFKSEGEWFYIDSNKLYKIFEILKKKSNKIIDLINN